MGKNLSDGFDKNVIPNGREKCGKNSSKVLFFLNHFLDF
jgi:hypothetical protein